MAKMWLLFRSGTTVVTGVQKPCRQNMVTFATKEWKRRRELISLLGWFAAPQTQTSFLQLISWRWMKSMKKKWVCFLPLCRLPLVKMPTPRRYHQHCYWWSRRALQWQTDHYHRHPNHPPHHPHHHTHYQYHNWSTTMRTIILTIVIITLRNVHGINKHRKQ